MKEVLEQKRKEVLDQINKLEEELEVIDQQIYEVEAARVVA